MAKNIASSIPALRWPMAFPSREPTRSTLLSMLLPSTPTTMLTTRAFHHTKKINKILPMEPSGGT
eukprot:CAMPEP_0178424206 /NCGR_PEP_ID=MMETSP0689_2-20121128/28090_1 /TAXON_ID=160604 /ORGANISM="Amphidinium massartii, Strain CS-259" /LENGTH=64 /DNA_ID=CAMNT_0020045835 /DNA_START=884 /DNA_END=1078 /DNA_ORIENTATION=-